MVETHCTKMGADSLAKNTPNNPEFICPSPKVLDFNEKRLHWACGVLNHEIAFKSRNSKTMETDNIILRL